MSKAMPLEVWRAYEADVEQVSALMLDFAEVFFRHKDMAEAQRLRERLLGAEAHGQATRKAFYDALQEALGG